MIPAQSTDRVVARPSRSDRYSIWSIAVIVIVLAYSLVFNNASDLIARHLNKHKTIATGTVTTNAFQDLVGIDTKVKQAYFEDYIASLSKSSLSHAGDSKVILSPNGSAGVSEFHKDIKSALSDSITALRKNPDSVFFARRVIALRSVLAEPPFASIPASGKYPEIASPLAAYELTAKESPERADQAHQQESYIESVFSNQSISSSQLSSLLAESKEHPTMLFYSLIASQNLYLDAGKGGSASRIHHYLGYRALLSIIGLVLVSLIAFVLFVAGAIIWIGSLVSLNFEKGSVNAFTRFLVPRPDRIDPAERKLRAGDLLDCFALYLIALDGIGILIDLAAEPFLGPKLRHMSDIGLIHLNVAADLIAYVGASGAALILLLYKAKKRGASLGEELGLSTKGAVRNLAYGAVGWGASLCLMLIVSGGLSHALHKLPDPENPALPLLAFAPDTISRFLLYGMAAIAAPFFEETFFRGVLLNALLLRFKPIYACLLTGFLFGSVHPVGIVEGLTLASLGAVFAWIAYLRKSLAPSMFSHFLQNSFAYLTVYFSFAIIFKP